MRILHVLNHVRESGNGVVNSVVELACQQSISGLSVGVLSAGGEYEKLLEEHGVKHYYLPHTGLKKKPLELIKTIFKYKHVVNEFQPDIVHAQMVPAIQLSRAGLKRSTKFPFIN